MSWCADNLTPDRRRDIAEQLIAESGTGRVMSREHTRSELIGLCPLHEESNPSFSYNYGKDVFNCSSGCGAGDLIELFTLLHGMDKKAGFREFVKEFAPDLSKAGKGKRRTAKAGPKPRPNLQVVKPPKVLPEEMWEAMPPLPESWLARLEKTRGWSREVMARLDLRLIKTGDTDRVAIPIRDEQGRLLNIRKYSPGAAENKVLSEKGHGEVRLWPLLVGYTDALSISKLTSPLELGQTIED